MHTLRSVIDDDQIWFQILKEFSANAKFCEYQRFFQQSKSKNRQRFMYFAEQYFYTPYQPHLEYYQTDSEFFYRWKDVNDNFIMLGFSINGEEKRHIPTKNFQSLK